MLNPHATELTPFPAETKWIVLVPITTRNAPYVYPRLDSILELCRTFPIGNRTSFLFGNAFIGQDKPLLLIKL